MHYLDYAATTPILEEVLEAMQPYQTRHFGNPSSVYGAGREAKKGIEQAREQVAQAVGADPSEIIFTAGGTEADNLALKGAAFGAGKAAGRIITVATEHHAVLHSAEWLRRRGFDVKVVGVDREGLVDLDALGELVSPDTIAVSIMMVNNEVGTIQPVSQVAALVKQRCRAVLHTDAVQGLGKTGIDLAALGVDLASFSAHKLGGPKGTGALYVRRRTRIEPLLHGGGQERDLRSGTPNVAGIAGFGVAAQIAAKEVEQESDRLRVLRDRLESRIQASIGAVAVNGGGAPRIAGTLNVCLSGIQGESLLLMLDREGIAASSGSACTSGSLEPSHVLSAMGVSKQLALGSLRLSLGRASTERDVDKVLEVLPPIVEKLRAVGR